ncbi:MAG: aminopeptidase P family protein [Blautia sp.]|nr:aminopeptidase P family protein [Lachnoclostridium sp.]MCM1211862.1 aminopeptidase P family protein [Blautia sp.]
MEIKDRIRQLQDRLKEEGINYYLIPTSDYHHSEYVSDYFKIREYFSGFTGSNGTLVVSQTEAGLWTDGRYFVQAQKELEGSGIVLFRMQEEGVPTIKEYLGQHMQKEEVLGFDGSVVTAAYGMELQEALQSQSITIRHEKDIAGSLWEDRPAMPGKPVILVAEALCGENVSEKLAKVREVMREKQCSAHLLAKLDDLMWLLNIRGADVACNPVALSYGYLTGTECYLFLQKKAMSEELSEYAAKWGITLKDYAEIGAFLESNASGRVLLDDTNVSYSLHSILQKKAEVVSAPNPSEKLKAVKNPVELANMEKVYLQDSVALTKFIYWLKKNIGNLPITEYSAAMHMDDLRRQIDGFLDLSFPTIAAYGENAAMMHYEATESAHKELKPEGMFLIDSGGQYLGGTTDVTRTIVLGKISEEMKLHFTAVAAGMLQLGSARFLYGCTGRNLDILAREPLWNLDIDYKCGTGHGVGYMLNVHEGPQNIRWRYSEGMQEAVIEAGMVTSNEPGVYKEGSYGIRTENIMVAQNGEKNGDGQFMYFDMLTYVPIDLEGIDTAFMRECDIERLNRYHEAVYEKISPYLDEEERKWLRGATQPLSGCS